MTIKCGKTPRPFLWTIYPDLFLDTTDVIIQSPLLIQTLRKIPGVKWAYTLFRHPLARVIQRYRYHRPVIEQIGGLSLLVLPQVLPPKLFRTGAYLARILSRELVPPGSHVLDMGTGSGVVSVVTAAWASRVVAIDINPEAVQCAKTNAARNNLEGKVDVRHGDLFEPVGGETFDRIIFNPPFLEGMPSTPFEQALYGGDTIHRFFSTATPYLKENGEILLLLSTLADVEQILAEAAKNGFSIALLCEKHYINESLMVYRLKP
jgi:release factor glutamine methyltransferase